MSRAENTANGAGARLALRLDEDGKIVSATAEGAPFADFVFQEALGKPAAEVWPHWASLLSYFHTRCLLDLQKQRFHLSPPVDDGPRLAVELVPLEGGMVELRAEPSDLPPLPDPEAEGGEAFRALAMDLPQGLVLLRKGLVVWANQVFLTVFGYTREEMLGLDAHRLIDPLDHPLLFERNLAGEGDEPSPGRAEITGRAASGAALDLEVSARLITLKDGPAVLVIVEDVSKRKEDERRLRESESRHRQTFETNLAVKLVIDPETGDIVDANWAACDFYGYSPEDLTDKNLADITNQPPEELLSQLKTALDQDELFLPFQQRLADGKLRDVEAYTGPFTVGGKSLLYTIVHDVTDRKKAEREAAMLARFTQENPNPVLRCSPSGTLLYVNRAGMVLCDGLGAGLGSPLPPTWRERIAQSLQEGNTREWESLLGGRRYRLVVVPLANNDTAYIYGEDVTEARRHEEEAQLAAKVLENSLEGIFVADAEENIQMVNAAFSRITGYHPEEALGRKPSFLKSGRHPEKFFRQLYRELESNGHWSGEIYNKRKNGEAFPLWQTITVLRDSEGQITNYVSIFHDLSDIKRSEEQVRHQAYHDALTGLPNRALFVDRLAMALAHARRSSHLVALLMLDLDNFKNINDSLGHAQGDNLLTKVADRLRDNLREGDTIARVGGDEFLMLLEQVNDEQHTVSVARRVMAGLASPFKVKDQELFITGSLGITMFPADGDDGETLLKNADMALYRAKEQGKNTYSLFAPEMNQKVVARLKLEADLRLALERQEFILHYQPKVDLSTGEVTGAEALVRWQKTDGTMVSPGAFIPLAEETGLIVPLGAWVLKEACRQTVLWHRAGHGQLNIAVNLSARQFMQESLLKQITDILEETGLDPARLELEITESTIMKNTEAASKILDSLARVGVKFSLDDFGTGYTSLYYLKRFPINVLKLDRTFVMDLPHDSDDVAISTAIIMLARGLDLKVVAEGVETREQLQFLITMGCDQLQGYYFSKPLPAGEFARLLAEGRRLDLG